MSILLATVLGAGLIGVQDPASRASREWVSTDPLVQFVEGSRWNGIPPRGQWSGRASVQVRCTVMSDGRLDGCEVVREAPPGRIYHRDARRAFGDARLEMTETGPQPGDRVTLEITVTRGSRVR